MRRGPINPINRLSHDLVADAATYPHYIRFNVFIGPTGAASSWQVALGQCIA
jgi:hypothetical protein